MKCDKITSMSKKKRVVLAGLVGAGILAASARFYKKIQEEQQKAQALQEVRAAFAKMGEIATVYIDETASSGHFLTGGIVMEDGRVYLFENERGDITYEEEVR